MNINKHIVEIKGNMLRVINEAKLPIAILELLIADIHNAIISQLQVELQKEDAPDENTDKSKEA